MQDPPVTLSARQLARLISVAAETGQRFSYSRRMDPVEWMYARQPLFSERSAIDACQDRPDYQRAIIAHGLCLSAMTKPGQIDALLLGSPASDPIGTIGPRNREARQSLRLFTVSITEATDSGRCMIFLAILARNEDAVALDVRGRFGDITAGNALVREGFDPSEPVAAALVSEPMGATLLLIADDPTSELAEGLDVQIESRFLN
ncbi:hypothetical protein [Novosphingobium barchaimii]|nr:hypothetical protein [Novosphingobium barchaimii]